MADRQLPPSYVTERDRGVGDLAERYEQLTGGPDARERSFTIRRLLHRELGMTLEQVRALPWYEHDSIMDELLAEFGVGQEEASIDELRDSGFTVVEG